MQPPFRAGITRKNINTGSLLFVMALIVTFTPGYQFYGFNGGAVTRTLETLQAHACDGDTMRIECPARTVISVQYAKYGRSVPSSSMCARPAETRPAFGYYRDAPLIENINCIAVRSLEVMLDMCEDRASCSVKASPETFTQDPCEGTSKYLEVHYKCKPNEYERQTVCEGDAVHISCNKGDGIAVYSAMFGRTPNGTDQCPANKHGYIDCQAADTVSEVRTQCHGKRNCAIQANESIFGDPCPMGTHKYLTVSYACVPRKILKQIHQKKNRKKKKKKKKKDQDKVTKLPRDDNFTDVSSSTQSASDMSSAPSLPEVYLTFEQLPVTKVGEEAAVTTGSVRQEENQKASTPLDSKATDVTTVQDKIPGLDDVTLVDERTSELDVSTVHGEASTFDDIVITEPSTEDSSTDTNKKTNDEVYYKSFEDITTSVILSPSSADQHKDNDNDVGSKQPNGSDAGHVRVRAEEINNSRPQSGSSNNTNHVKHEDSNSFGRVKEDTSAANPTRSPQVETTHSTVSTNIQKDTGSDHKSVPNSNYTMEKKDSAFVTERNLTVLCMNYTRPDVRWGGMQRPRDHRTIGFLKDWLSICHYLKTHEEKAWLYFTLGICFGIIVMLVVVLVKVCCNFRRNIRARLDVSEPTHRSAHINNHSSLDAPMLEHSDSMDRIEVVRFSPRSTLRSLRSNSHNRDLVNYYG